MRRRSGSPSVLPLLRSESQAGLLERLLLHPDRSYTVAELASELGVTDMSVRRELGRMVDAGIADRQLVGRQGLFRASTASPLYTPLREVVERSVGVEPLLREVLEEFSGVESAAIFGSWAEGRVDAESDIDVLIIGEFDYADLTSRILAVQERAGREINVVAMRRGELGRRLAEGSGFAREIMSSPMRVLVGEIEPA